MRLEARERDASGGMACVETRGFCTAQQRRLEAPRTSKVRWLRQAVRCTSMSVLCVKLTLWPRLSAPTAAVSLKDDAWHVEDTRYMTAWLGLAASSETNGVHGARRARRGGTWACTCEGKLNGPRHSSMPWMPTGSSSSSSRIATAGRVAALRVAFPQAVVKSIQSRIQRADDCAQLEFMSTYDLPEFEAAFKAFCRPSDVLLTLLRSFVKGRSSDRLRRGGLR